MTENALTPQQSFEEKVKSRLKENIGDLMPDEVLQDMVKKAMQEMFFTRREKKQEGWSGRTEVFPSWFEDEVSRLLKDRVLEEIKIGIENKREEIRKAASELITEKLPEFITSQLLNIVTGITQLGSWQATDALRNDLRNRGFQV